MEGVVTEKYNDPLKTCMSSTRKTGKHSLHYIFVDTVVCWIVFLVGGPKLRSTLLFR